MKDIHMNFGPNALLYIANLLEDWTPTEKSLPGDPTPEVVQLMEHIGGLVDAVRMLVIGDRVNPEAVTGEATDIEIATGIAHAPSLFLARVLARLSRVEHDNRKLALGTGEARAERDAALFSRDQLAKLFGEAAALLGGDWNDAKDEWAEAVDEAFPTRSGSHEAYSKALRMVSARHSKGELVALTNWLLHGRDTARHELAALINKTENRNATDACSGDWERCWCTTCRARRDVVHGTGEG
jgi:hypothetical protein